jgi:hypothetical protein
MFRLLTPHAWRVRSGPQYSLSSSMLQVYRMCHLTYCFEYRMNFDQDCGDVVASKFFPIDGPDGKQQPLCERDYFKRLNLICAKCGMALRGSYITACSAWHTCLMTTQVHLTPIQTESSTSSISRAPYVRRFSGHKTRIMNTTATCTAIIIIRRALRQNVRVATPQF